MSILNLILITYGALLATIIWHELGHFPKKLRMVQWFPWPEANAIDARYRYGGLILNILALFLIFKYQPQNQFLLLFGLFNWVHFILYSIFGSINLEIKYPKWMIGEVVFDDVPNKLAIIFIPLGIVVFWFLKGFYLPILLGNWFAIMLVGYILLKSIKDTR